MQFLTFLREGYKETKAQLVLQKVIDMVDDGHIEYSKDKMDINLGKLIKDANLYDLHLIIRKGKKNSVRLGRNKLDNELSIVIDTDYYPQRQNVGKLFAKEDIVKGFQDAFHEYMKKHHEPKDHENKTQHETSKEVNTRKGFERNFKSLEQKIKDKMQEYKAAKAKLDDGLGKSALASHKASHKAALDHLKKEMLGNSAKEFVSKMMKLADEKFSANMDADAKKKLQSRLVSYFEHEFVKDPEHVKESILNENPTVDVNTWFERDRAHVEVTVGGDSYVNWWDDEVKELVEDGFLNPRDWKGSAIEYCKHLGLLDANGYPTPKKVKKFVTEGMFSSDYDERREDMPFGLKADRGDDSRERDDPHDEQGNDAPGPDHYYVAEMQPDGSINLYDDGDYVDGLSSAELQQYIRNGWIDGTDIESSFVNFYVSNLDD